jgi:hypothetical protein
MLWRSDIVITLSLYGRVTPPMRKEAADTMEQIFAQDGQNGACARWRSGWRRSGAKACAVSTVE